MRRDRLEIIYDILSSCIEGEKTGWLMLKSRLSYRTLKKYLELLTNNGFVQIEKTDGDQIYTTTPQGKELTKKIHEIYNASGLDFYSTTLRGASEK